MQPHSPDGRLTAVSRKAVARTPRSSGSADHRTRCGQSLTFLQIAEKMRRAMGIRLKGDPVRTIEVVGTRYLLNEGERSGLLRHLIEGGDLSAYGLVNAVTHFSQDVDDYDRATEFEALGGRLLEQSKAEWDTLAEAA